MTMCTLECLFHICLKFILKKKRIKRQINNQSPEAPNFPYKPFIIFLFLINAINTNTAACTPEEIQSCLACATSSNCTRFNYKPTPSFIDTKVKSL